MKEKQNVDFFKKDGGGRPDFHELHLLFQLFLEFPGDFQAINKNF